MANSRLSFGCAFAVEQTNTFESKTNAEMRYNLKFAIYSLYK